MSVYQSIHAIHQILIVDSGDLPDPLPKALTDSQGWVKRFYPDASYRLWSGDDIRAFLQGNFEPDVLEAFDTLRPYSYRCDLARFCLLYKLGGMYLDLGVRVMAGWNIPVANGIAAFRDVAFISRSWSAIQTGVLWSEPGRPELRLAISYIVENCRLRYYGENPLYPTGPVLLGRAFIAAMVSKGQSPAADDQRIGQCRAITPDSGMRNVSYVSWEGTLVALRTKVVDGDLGHLGLSGVNDYNAMWRARQAYGEIERAWAGTDPCIQVNPPASKTASGVAIPLGATGRLVFGPYLDLAPGEYRLRVAFASDVRPAGFSVDVSAANGTVTLHTAEAATAGAGPGCFETDFTTTQDHRGVEFRFSVFGDFVGEIRRLSLLRKVKRIWAFDDAAIGIIGMTRSASGVVIPMGTQGRVLYGPYTRLTAGRYQLTVHLSPETVYSRLMVEICGQEGNSVLHTHVAKARDTADEADLGFSFELADLVIDAEFRLIVYGDFSGEFRGYTLEQTDESISPQLEDVPAAEGAATGRLRPSATGRMLKLKELLWGS